MGYARILPIAKPPRQVYSSGPDIGLPPVTVDPDRLRTELERACEDAGLDPSRWVVWIVDGVPPAGTTPIAYLQPAGEVRTDTVIVFRAVGVKRARPHRLAAHRLAVWRLLPGLPDAALGPMLRHEVEHARRWERSGTAFYDADERLRAGMGRSGYPQLPTEREANAAALAYARRILTVAELADLRACGEFGDLLACDPVPPDVVEATLALLGETDVSGVRPQTWPQGTVACGPLVEVVAAVSALDTRLGSP